jgi:hypothetical protein
MHSTDRFFQFKISAVKVLKSFSARISHTSGEQNDHV